VFRKNNPFDYFVELLATNLNENLTLHSLGNAESKNLKTVCLFVKHSLLAAM